MARKSSESKAPIIAAFITGIFAILVAIIGGCFNLQAAKIKQDSIATSTFQFQNVDTPTSTPSPTQTVFPNDTLQLTDTSTPLPSATALASVRTPLPSETPTTINSQDTSTASLYITCVDFSADNPSWIRTFLRKFGLPPNGDFIDVYDLYLNYEKVQRLPENQPTMLSVKLGTLLVQVKGDNSSSQLSYNPFSSDELVLNIDVGDTAELECGMKNEFSQSLYLKVIRFTKSTK